MSGVDPAGAPGSDPADAPGGDPAEAQVGDPAGAPGGSTLDPAAVDHLEASHEEQPPGQPVRFIPGDRGSVPTTGTALCMSGGGYRAMLFHVGVLWRLNEAGMLSRLRRVSSVSGGSITSGVMAMNWGRLGFDAQGVAQEFVPQVVAPIRAMAAVNIDITSVLSGMLMPFTTISERVIRAYSDHLFGETSLQDLPGAGAPTFVFNATNLESGVLMRFSKAYAADYRVGRIPEPDLPLAVAVAASSAFPPFLSPCIVDLGDQNWVTEEGNDLTGPEFRREIRLSDGGVYDNLGLETAWKLYSTILVSDAGGSLAPEPDPSADWGRGLLRVLHVMDNQVRALRKRQLVDSFRRRERNGMYVGVRSATADYGLADALPADPAVTRELADVATRLTSLDADLQERLINWGYVICDTGLRAHVLPDAAPGRLPYPTQLLVRG